jgi:hypothetical protein
MQVTPKRHGILAAWPASLFVTIVLGAALPAARQRAGPRGRPQRERRHVLLPDVPMGCPIARLKVFWFFFSKKNYFLT